MTTVLALALIAVVLLTARGIFQLGLRAGAAMERARGSLARSVMLLEDAEAALSRDHRAAVQRDGGRLQ